MAILRHFLIFFMVSILSPWIGTDLAFGSSDPGNIQKEKKTEEPLQVTPSNIEQQILAHVPGPVFLSLHSDFKILPAELLLLCFSYFQFDFQTLQNLLMVSRGTFQALVDFLSGPREVFLHPLPIFFENASRILRDPFLSSAQKIAQLNSLHRDMLEIFLPPTPMSAEDSFEMLSNFYIELLRWKEIGAQVISLVREQSDSLACDHFIPQLEALDLAQASDQTGNELTRVCRKVWSKVNSQAKNKIRDKELEKERNKNKIHQDWYIVVHNAWSQASPQIIAEVRDGFEEVWNQVMGLVSAQAGDRIWNQLDFQLREDVGVRLDVQVKAELGDEAKRRVGAQVRAVLSNFGFPLAYSKENLSEMLRPLTHYIFLIYQLVAILKHDSKEIEKIQKISKDFANYLRRKLTEEQVNAILFKIIIPESENPLINIHLKLLSESLSKKDPAKN